MVEQFHTFIRKMIKNFALQRSDSSVTQKCDLEMISPCLRQAMGLRLGERKIYVLLFQLISRKWEAKEKKYVYLAHKIF